MIRRKVRKNKDLFSIFPADAGVNLWFLPHKLHLSHIPRGCGGEPIRELIVPPASFIFPADAGVNL